MDGVLTAVGGYTDLVSFSSVSRAANKTARRANSVFNIAFELGNMLSARRPPPGSDPTFLGTFIHHAADEHALGKPHGIFLHDWESKCLLKPLPALSKASICTIAAAFGKLEWLQILRGQGDMFPWGDTLRAAAGAGHIDVFKWAWDLGCPFTHFSTEWGHDGERAMEDFGRPNPENVCVMAAAGGHLAVLQHLRSLGAQLEHRRHYQMGAGQIGAKERHYVLGVAWHRRDFAMMDWLILQDFDEFTPEDLTTGVKDTEQLNWIRQNLEAIDKNMNGNAADTAALRFFIDFMIKQSI